MPQSVTMASSVKNNLNILKLLTRVKPSVQRSIVHASDEGLICSICEAADNALKGNVILTARQKRKLARHRNILRSLSKRGETWRKKKKIIVQKGGFLLPLLIPVISTLVGALLSK